MTIASVPSLVEALRQHRLLTPAQMVDLTRNLQPHFADPKALARELLRRQWLTPQQLNRLFQAHTAAPPAVAVPTYGSSFEGRRAAARRRSQWWTKVAALLFVVGGLGLGAVVWWQMPTKARPKNSAAAADAAERDRREREKIAEREMQGFRDQANDLSTDPTKLRQMLLNFREQYAGLPQTAEAGVLIAALPSPLDRLSATAIDQDEQFPNMPNGLVAVLGHSIWRNWGKAKAAAFTPKGAQVVSAGDDGIVRIRVRKTGTVRRALSVGPVLALNIVNRGQVVQVAQEDGDVSRWDVAEGTRGKVVSGPIRQPTSVSLSDENGVAVSAAADGTVKVWDVNEGKERATIKNEGATVTVVAVSADGRLAATGDAKGQVRVWDAGSGELRGELSRADDAPPQPTRCLAFTGNGARLAAGEDVAITVWEVGSGKVLALFLGQDKPLNAVAFSPDGRQVASAGEDQTVRLWEIGKDVRTAKMLTKFEGHLGPVLSVAFSEEGASLVSAGGDGAVRVWDLGEKKEETLLYGHSGALAAVAFSPDCETLASGGLDRKIKLWDVGTAAEKTTFVGHEDAVCVLAFVNGGKLLASASFDGSVRLWDPSKQKEPVTLAGDPGALTTLALSGDGQTLAVGGATSRGGLLTLWNVPQKKQTTSLEGLENAVVGLALSGDGRALAAATAEGSLRTWAGPPWQATGSFSTGGPVVAFTLAPDGRTVATADDKGTVKTWDLMSKKPGLTFPAQAAAAGSLAFTPDGKGLAAAYYDGHIVYWDAVSGAKIREWQLPGGVNGVAVATDGRHLATANANGTIFIIRLAEWQPRKRKN